MSTLSTALPAAKLIEEQLLATLRALPRNYGLKTIESYAGQLDDQAWSWLRGTPCVWVNFVSGTPQRVGGRSLRVEGKFSIVAAQRNIANTSLARLGDAAEPGVYQILEDNKQAVWNQQLGLPIDPLAPGAIRQLLAGQTQSGEPLAVYAQEFDTRWYEILPDVSARDGTLTNTYLNYFLQPGDAVQDAQDIVTHL